MTKSARAVSAVIAERLRSGSEPQHKVRDTSAEYILEASEDAVQHGKRAADGRRITNLTSRGLPFGSLMYYNTHEYIYDKDEKALWSPRMLLLLHTDVWAGSALRRRIEFEMLAFIYPGKVSSSKQRLSPWCSRLSRSPHTRKGPGSSPGGDTFYSYFTFLGTSYFETLQSIN